MKPEDQALYLYDRVSGYQSALVLMTANHLDLFSTLGDISQDAGGLSQQLSTDTRATAHLADALVALGFLAKDAGAYSNTAISKKYLVRGAAEYQGDIIRHHEQMHGRWSKLPEIVRQGSVPGEEPEARSPKDTDAFIRGMANIGVISARELAQALDLRGVRKVLDIGGGPGVYTIEILRRLPQATGVILDLEEPLRIASEFVAKAGMEDRITLQPGDYHEADFGQEFDLVIVSNIIHSLAPEDNVRLLAKAEGCLSSSGRVILKDFLFDENRTGPAFAALFAINMLVGTCDGTTWTYGEISDWLRQSSLEPIQCFPLARYSHVIVAGKKA